MEDYKAYYSDNAKDFSFREELIEKLFLQKKNSFFGKFKSNDSLFEEALQDADSFLKKLFETIGK